jgi:hypothetical protein
MLRHGQSYYQIESALATHPAQAQLAGPVQVKVYKTSCSDKVAQPKRFTYLHRSPQRASFSAILASDINLRRIFFVLRTLLSVATTAAAVAAVFAIFFSAASIFFIVFRRGFRYLDALPSLFLLDQLKRTYQRA